jgi:hypothetical protein
MTGIESRWDDELAYEVLQRHAAEDLHAGIYDSYLAIMRSMRAHFTKVTPKNETERDTLTIMDQEYASAIRDERPLAPLYSRDWATRVRSLSLLELYRIEPDSGLVVPTTAVTVAYVDLNRTAALIPTPAFTVEQVTQVIEHHEELLDNGLVPRRPSE